MRTAMRTAIVAALLVPALAASVPGSNFDPRQAPGLVPLNNAPVDPVVPVVITSSSTLVATTTSAVVATTSSTLAKPAVPVVASTSSTTTSSALVNAPVNPAVPVVPTTTSAPVVASPGDTESITVQWRETWVGGTSQTWVPITITFKYPAHMTQAAAPGVGSIGMGTLTGEVGRMKTVDAAGAAATDAPMWRRGFVAAVGVGLAGLVV